MANEITNFVAGAYSKVKNFAGKTTKSVGDKVDKLLFGDSSKETTKLTEQQKNGSLFGGGNIVSEAVDGGKAIAKLKENGGVDAATAKFMKEESD